MNRKIEYRALTEYKTWFEYGYIVKEHGTNYWYVDDGSGTQKKVMPETIGQFTGLLDKNKKEIYEGDIFEIVFNEFFGTNIIIVHGKVVFVFGGFHVEFIHPETKKLSYVLLHELLKNPDKEIIGNIHQNPNLLNHV